MTLPHSPYPWYSSSFISKTHKVPAQPPKSSPPTSTESTCSETIYVPEMKPMVPDHISINALNRSETVTIEVDVVHIEPITAKNDENNSSSDPNSDHGQGFTQQAASTDYSKLYTLNTEPLNKYKISSKSSENKSNTPTSI